MISSVVRTVLVYLAVVVAMRLMGKRQLGELQPAELVTTLLISNVASICIDEPDLPLSASLVPIFLITALEILNSTLVWFCPKYAQLLLGKPVTIIRNGENSAGRTGTAAHHGIRPGRGPARQGHFFPQGCLLGRDRAERQHHSGPNAAGRRRAAYAAAAHR